MDAKYDSKNGLFDARAVANEIIKLARRDGRPITLLALLKILYFAHAWSLALLERPLVRSDLEAWVYGPVAPSVYHELKHHGREPIEEQIRDRNLDEPFDTEEATPEHMSGKAVIRLAWNLYKDLRPGQLVALTHKTGSPWDKDMGREPAAQACPQ